MASSSSSSIMASPDQNVNLWKEALTEVAGLAGEVLSSFTPEAECQKKIIETVYEKLDCKKYFIFQTIYQGWPLDTRISVPL
ncbi:unnamed protein product [Lactuca virosa]|uniref:Rx N-terminal domain-containing protein n=1 Tax=Lactuca virosa TaxID=75947 RepID=A0AAU9PGP7_9ASTR|nr:unnamed protein product [Lactuca virosa]